MAAHCEGETGLDKEHPGTISMVERNLVHIVLSFQVSCSAMSLDIYATLHRVTDRFMIDEHFRSIWIDT